MDNNLNIDYAKVGLKMKELRNKKGITQEKVADDLDCTIAFVSNVENNRAKLNLRVLLHYARLCNVSVDTLLSAGNPDAPADIEDTLLKEELLNIFKTFSTKEQKKIVDMLKLWKAD